MGAHCITDYRAIKTVQNCSKIQLTVCTFDFGHIADVLRSGRRCGKIPSYQIIILRCMKISLCQAMRTLFAY